MEPNTSIQNPEQGKHRIRDIILLTRPYSWGNMFLVGVWASIISNNTGGLELMPIFLAGLWSLLAWCILLLLHESAHKYEYRAAIKPGAVFFVLIIFTIVAYLGNRFVATLYAIPCFLTFAWLYSKKHKSMFSALIAPFIRPLFECIAFTTVAMSTTGFNIQWGQIVLPLVVLYCFTLARNILGDLRDLRFDANNFSLVIGGTNTIWASCCCALLGAVTAPHARPAIILLVAVFVGLAYQIHSHSSLLTIGYRLHRIGCALTAVCIALMIKPIATTPIMVFVLAILAIHLVLIFVTYGEIPRRANAVYQEERLHDHTRRPEGV